MSIILHAIQNHQAGKNALIGDTRKLTYRELDVEIHRRAKQLADVTVVGLALDNGCDWVVWDLAAVKAGVPCVPIPPFFTLEQTDHLLHSAGISHLVLEEGISATGIDPTENIPEQTSKVTFTSGTTGAPKGVCLSQDGMEQVAQSLVGVLGQEMAKRHVSVLPLAVLLENIAGVYASFLAGGTVYTPSLKVIGFAKPFQPDFFQLSNYINNHEITSAIVVPELLRGLMAVSRSHPTLEFVAVGGSKTSPDLISMARNIGIPVYEGYGLSECASVVSLNVPGDDRIGSVGRVLPHVQLIEEDGEIVIENAAFLGYLGDRSDRKLPTGDLGYRDGNGFLFVAGRKKNTLITSYGRNISPEWVESTLLAQAEIAQAVVYGDAQPFLRALIVPASAQVSIEEAVERCNATLPDYAHIRSFQLVTPFTAAENTLTGTGRPRRETILKRYLKEINNELLHQVS